MPPQGAKRNETKENKLVFNLVKYKEKKKNRGRNTRSGTEYIFSYVLQTRDVTQGKGKQSHNNFEERMNKKYSFKKEVVVKLFSDSV